MSYATAARPIQTQPISLTNSQMDGVTVGPVALDLASLAVAVGGGTVTVPRAQVSMGFSSWLRRFHAFQSVRNSYSSYYSDYALCDYGNGAAASVFSS